MQALSGEDITIYGDGGQTRSFCYVDDLIDGLVRLMNNETEVSRRNRGKNSCLRNRRAKRGISYATPLATNPQA